MKDYGKCFICCKFFKKDSITHKTHAACLEEYRHRLHDMHELKRRAARIRRRSAVLWFSDLMERKLKQNDFKSGWDSCSFKYLLDRTRDEIDELLYAWFNHRHKEEWNKPLDDKDSDKIIKECVDIANFVMMIADNTRNNNL